MKRNLFFMMIAAVLVPPAQAAAEAPAAVFKAYVSAVNSGDMQAVDALIGSNPGRPSRYSCAPELSNRDCLLSYLQNTVVTQHTKLLPIRTTIVGNLVRVKLEVRNDLTRAADVSRFTGVDEVTVRDGKIINFAFFPSRTDPQTSKFFDFMRSTRGAQPSGAPSLGSPPGNSPPHH